MTFEELWTECLEGSSNGKAVARATWNAALEEAAKKADQYLHACCISEEIRSLKEE